MNDPRAAPGVAGPRGEALLDQQLAARVRRRDDRGAGRADVTHLAVAQPGGGPRLRERVHARASAAHRRLGAFAQVHSRNRPEELPRLGRDPLAVAEVARLVVGDGDGLRARRGRRGPPEPDGDQPLRDVADLARPGVRPGGVGGVVREQVAVALEVRAASRRVRDDRVEPVGIDRAELAPSELARRLEVAVVGVEGAAAGLPPGRLHLAAVLEKDVGRRPVDVGEGDVLDAAREEGDPEPRGPRRPLGGADEGVGEAPADRHSLPLDLAEAFRQEPEEAAGAQEPAESARLVEPQEPRRGAQRPGPQQQQAQRQGPDQPAPGAGGGAAPLGLGAPGLEERAVVDPGGAGGRARKAPEAVVHLPREARGRLQLAVGDRAHERDPPPRRMALPARLEVRGARGQAQPAVHALLEHRVVERAQEVRLRAHGSKIFPGLRRFPGSSACLTRLSSA